MFVIGAAFALYHGALQNVFLSRNTKDQETALQIASGKLEELRADGYAALPASGSFTDAQLAALPGGSAALAVSAYNAQTKQVTVTVSWLEPGIGSTRSTALSTLITETGGL